MGLNITTVFVAAFSGRVMGVEPHFPPSREPVLRRAGDPARSTSALRRLWEDRQVWAIRQEGAVAAALCRRTPN